MKILVVTTSFGQFSDSHTVRLLNMLSQLPDNYSITYCYPATFGKDQVNIALSPNHLLRMSSYLQKHTRYLYRIFANLTKNLYFPDRFSGFSKAAVNHFEDKFEYDVILSASGSIESHITGYKIAKKFRKPLVLDYGDPIFSLVTSNKTEKIRAIENEILDYATHVIFTTYATKNQYDLEFGCANKSTVVHYGYDQNKIDTSCLLDTCDINFSSVLYFTHIGTAFTNDRNLSPFIEALSLYQKQARENVGFILAGRRSLVFSELANKLLIDNFKDYELLDYNLALEIQRKSEVNIIVGNKDGRQVPGKIFALAAVSKKILYINQCDIEDDESLKILSKHRGLFICRNEKKDLLKTITKMLELDSSPQESYEFEEYESSNLSKKILDIIDAC